jgi:hypothetical protein
MDQGEPYQGCNRAGEWQTLYDPSFFGIIRIHAADVDLKLHCLAERNLMLALLYKL